MKIIRVNKKLVRKFVDFPDALYAGDPNYVPYMKRDQIKTLKKLICREKRYTALLAVDGKKILGRILLTVDKNKQLKTDRCGFFSMFECVNDASVCKALLDEATHIVKEQGAQYLSGTYFPYDQDNRRGILVKGFEDPPLIFTSYNKPYYDELLKGCGLEKQTDALQYKIGMETIDYSRCKKVSDYSQNKFNFRIDTVDWNEVDRDIADVHAILQAATTEIVYQDAPSMEALQSIVKGWKVYLKKEYILIARSNETNEPLGVVIALPDYFQIFRKMGGKLNTRGMLIFLRERKKIKSIRAMIQYVIPKYQKMGVTMALYCRLYEAALKNGVTRMEAGTIMENNLPSYGILERIGGELARVYRIYYKEI